MPTFTVQNSQFRLDNRPLLIQAGEFHYFRAPRDVWRHRLGLLHDAGFNAVATYIPWLWHQPDEGIADFEGHTHPQRDLAGFLDLCAELDFLIIARPGPYIMAETINEGIPPWVFARHPQIAFTSADGKAQNIVSYLHPAFLAEVRRWYKAVFEVLTPRQITHGGKIVMIQLDNEMGMMPWVRNIIDTNRDTLARFAAYLTGTYGDRLESRYPTLMLRRGDLSDFLTRGLADPTTGHAASLMEDYRRFYRGYLGEYAMLLWDEAQANGMDTLPVINIHGFGNGGKTFPIGLSQLVEAMSTPGMVSATDVYPLSIHEGNFHHMLLVNAMTQALQNPDQPLFSIEFQAGGNGDFWGCQTSLYDLHARLCISQGMRAINHYLFADGENHPLLSPTKRHDWGHPIRKDGTVRRHYGRYGKLSAELAQFGDDLVLSRPQVVTTIGFQLDNYMTEVNTTATAEATKVITHQRDAILFDFIARGLALTHRPFDAVDLQRGALAPTRYPLIWAMMDRQCDAHTQQKLVDYVNSGGHLILVGRMCVEEFNHAPCTILMDALGVKQATSDEPFTPTFVDAFGYEEIPASFVETYSGQFDEVVAVLSAATQDRRDVVGFIKTRGRGRALMFGAALGAMTLEDLDVVNRIAAKMGCPPLFRLSDWADVRISRGEQAAYLFVNNYQDDPVATTIEYAGRLLFGGQPVTLPARSGTILLID